eukprot:1688749-Alexandrium_andersonii.AAC.1
MTKAHRRSAYGMRLLRISPAAGLTSRGTRDALIVVQRVRPNGFVAGGPALRLGAEGAPSPESRVGIL